MTNSGHLHGLAQGYAVASSLTCDDCCTGDGCTCDRCDFIADGRISGLPPMRCIKQTGHKPEWNHLFTFPRITTARKA